VRLSTKYYIAWIFILSLLILPEPSISKAFLYLFLSWSAIMYGKLEGKPEPGSRIQMEKARGQWDK
jgi:hypothetical protein